MQWGELLFDTGVWTQEFMYTLEWSDACSVWEQIIEWEQCANVLIVDQWCLECMDNYQWIIWFWCPNIPYNVFASMSGSCIVIISSNWDNNEGNAQATFLQIFVFSRTSNYELFCSTSELLMQLIKYHMIEKNWNRVYRKIYINVKTEGNAWFPPWSSDNTRLFHFVFKRYSV